jgi:hypothetical protein
MDDKELTDDQVATKAVLEVGDEIKVDAEEIVTLERGFKVKITPVPGMLITEAISRVQEPKVPIVWNDKKDREEPNYQDPTYVAAMQRYEAQKVIASTNAAIRMGVRLIDGLPEDDSWIDDLQELGFDEVERGLPARVLEFYYMKFIVVTNRDIKTISRVMGFDEAEITSKEETFRR